MEGIYTHFSNADDRDKSCTKRQFETFKRVLDRLEEEKIHIQIKHAANSATILDLPEYKLDMVRPGIILYGHYPSESVNQDIMDLQPAMALKSRISNIKELDKGIGVGYGQTFVTKRKSKIATLPIGYADGYSRMLSRKAEVSIHNKRVAVVGNICMDQLMIDITDVQHVDLNDKVVLFGYRDKNEPTVEELGELLGTIHYEILCMISMRVPRVYMNHGKFI